ncbi:ParB N-terminal domain-containing protein [Patescibacteria group bacterium]|nr:ParB N-terminal domain-containing protein [Patescibacteria group bacterium]
MKESVKDIRAISTIKPYGKNPRSITTEDFKLLKKHIKKLDQFKPVIINQDGIILGGNMRYLAYLELGIKDVWVSEVKTKSEQEIIEYNLIDNQRYGSYNDQLLAELILPYQSDLDLQDYKVDLEMPKIDLGNVLDFFGPGGEMKIDEKEVDENLETEHTCPKCGYQWS